MKAISKRIFRGEIEIKSFYKTTFKIIRKVNKLASIGGRGIKLAKTLIKKSGISKDKDVKKMSDNEFKEWLIITDEKQMKKLLSRELITIEYIKP